MTVINKPIINALLIFVILLTASCGIGSEDVATNNTALTEDRLNITADDTYDLPMAYTQHPAWMTNINNIERATLGALTLPGTHDSGAYELDNIIAPTDEGKYFTDTICDYFYPWGIGEGIAKDVAKTVGQRFGITQNLNIHQQLASGIRFFDLRIVYSVDDFYIHHGLLGDSLSHIFTDISTFMQNEAGDNEVVIISIAASNESTKSSQISLNGSIVCHEISQGISTDMSLEHHEELVNMIEAYLGEYLYRKNDANVSFPDVRIGEITKSGPGIIVLRGAEDVYPKYLWPDFLWSFGDNLDTNWANKDKLNVLITEQQEFIDGYYTGSMADLLELQWTLTAQPGVITKSSECELWSKLECDTEVCLLGVCAYVNPFCYIIDNYLSCVSHPYDSVHDLSEMTNPNLNDFIYQQEQKKLNIIRMDFIEESPLVDIALDHPVAICEDVIVSADGQCQANASIDGGSSDTNGDSLTLTQYPSGPYNLGKTLVDLTVSDSALYSFCSAEVSVIDTTGPDIESLVVTPDSSWPPNHKMWPVLVEVEVSDTCDPNPICKIAYVTSNESVGQGEGSGNTEPDCEISGDLTLELRSERSGELEGREYEITVECKDNGGNSTFDATYFTVPKSANH